MKTLRIIGCGVMGLLHLTQESLHHINHSKKILWLGTINGLEQLIYKNKLNSEDITPYYKNGHLDVDNYKSIKTKILSELKRFGDIAFLVLGHPRLGVTLVQELQKDCDNHHFDLQVIPGISSFDTMINDVGIDPLEEGTCLVDANRLLLYDYHMNPCLNYFIYHVCSIGNANTDYQFPQQRNAVDFLKTKLSQHFPLQHKIILLSSSASLTCKPILLNGTIENINLLLNNVSYAASLFIPGVLPKATQINKKFYDLVVAGPTLSQEFL